MRHRTVFSSDEQVIRHETAFLLWLMQIVINFVMEDAATWHAPRWQLTWRRAMRAADVAPCHAGSWRHELPRWQSHVSPSQDAMCLLPAAPCVVFWSRHMSGSGGAMCLLQVEPRVLFWSSHLSTFGCSMWTLPVATRVYFWSHHTHHTEAIHKDVQNNRH